MMQYEVWTEGYTISGSVSGADFHGIFESDTFAGACLGFRDSLPQKSLHYFNDEQLTFFGCKFFDNESDARKSFG